MTKRITLPPPDLQIAFSDLLIRMRSEVLYDALLATVGTLTIADIDKELARVAPQADITRLAANGLRGELMFAVPTVLSANPRLLGYYRLLLGYSKKEFYQHPNGLATFANLEESGTLRDDQAPRLGEIAAALATSASALLSHLSDPIRVGHLDDLTLLTLGPQLRGGANVRKGTSAIQQVFDLIRDLIGPHATQVEDNEITLTNSAGREVHVRFASDPDIVIREITPSGPRNLVAIEVKGGKDYSNIHNRIGEAEKSHNKARAGGFVECWTVVNVDDLDMTMAKRESPTTNRFYSLTRLLPKTGPEWDQFRASLISSLGIPD